MKRTQERSRDFPVARRPTARLPRASRASQARASRATCALPARPLVHSASTHSPHSVLRALFHEPFSDTSAHSTLSLSTLHPSPTTVVRASPSSPSTHVRTALCPALFWRVASALRQSGEDTLPLPSAFPRFGNRQMRMMRLLLPSETG